MIFLENCLTVVGIVIGGCTAIYILYRGVMALVYRIIDDGMNR